METMEKTLKIILARLLLSCLPDMPYGYYQLVRFLATAGFSYRAYGCHRRQAADAAFVYLFLALLFQPFAKVVLDRDGWLVVNGLV
jgi:hypothetical protein